MKFEAADRFALGLPRLVLPGDGEGGPRVVSDLAQSDDDERVLEVAVAASVGAAAAVT
jgi:hypothetical protein